MTAGPSQLLLSTAKAKTSVRRLWAHARRPRPGSEHEGYGPGDIRFASRVDLTARCRKSDGNGRPAAGAFEERARAEGPGDELGARRAADAGALLDRQRGRDRLRHRGRNRGRLDRP